MAKLKKKKQQRDRAAWYQSQTDPDTLCRFQTSTTVHDCDSEQCPLDGRILPQQRYARVFYDDINEVEKFHKSCFEYEFGIKFR